MKKKKWRDIRNAVTMMCVMVAMLSTATYAWFTLTSNPTVAGMEMVAASSSGLSVCKRVDGEYVNAIEITQGDEDNMNKGSDGKSLLKLRPVSLASNDGTAILGFSDPSYDEKGIVTDLEKDDDDNYTLLASNDLVGKVAEYTYYIKSESGNVGVGIITGNYAQSNPSSVNAGNQATANGTFVRAREVATGETADQAVEAAIGAVRIGIIVTPANESGGYNDPNIANMIIIEPNNDFVVSGEDITSANAELTSLEGYDKYSYQAKIVPSYIVANKDGTITKNGSGTTSSALFTVSETPKKVTMYIWLEGTDSQCVDQIKTDEIEAQIQFTGLGETTENSDVPFTMN